MKNFKIVCLIVLFVVLIASALAVVYSKYDSRLLFIEIQAQEQALNQAEVEWGQMQMELTNVCRSKTSRNASR
ncbi:cell division protein FtsL [Methylocucumis oryzae]|uniref:cell division protein FtsL n=1 Tax=Methylocucumis oryzae TaxID=1632867 RepID=UPI00308426F6